MPNLFQNVTLFWLTHDTFVNVLITEQAKQCFYDLYRNIFVKQSTFNFVEYCSVQTIVLKLITNE